MKKRKILLGTRGSNLAIWQANWVKNLITNKYPDILVDLVIIKTKGDKILDVSLSKVGGKGLFIKEIEEALFEGKIDIAVHSMKDMPADLPNELCIGAIPEREDARDILICKEEFSILKAPKGAKIGTSSLRRSAQLSYHRPDFNIVPIRGNIETRITKLKKQKMDAIILAAAGVIRLGLEHLINQYLDTKFILPAVGQGALCVEIRENDFKTRQIINFLDDSETRCLVLAERAFLNCLNGNCQVPIASNAVLKDGHIILTGLVASVDGSKVIKKTLIGPLNSPEQIGIELAEILLSFGAKDILKEFI